MFVWCSLHQHACIRKEKRIMYYLEKTPAQILTEARKTVTPVVFVNIQTTGLSKESDILQINASKYSVADDYCLTAVDSFSKTVRVHNPVTPEILNFTGLTRDQLENSKELPQVALDFKHWLGDRKIFIGTYYSPFLRDMMSILWENGVAFPNIEIFDVMNFVTRIKDQLGLKDTKLSSVAATLGFEVSKSGLDKTVLLASIFQKIMKRASVVVPEMSGTETPTVKLIQREDDYTLVFHVRWYGKIKFDIRTREFLDPYGMLERVSAKHLVDILKVSKRISNLDDLPKVFPKKESIQ